jgi:hypothetical protein
MKRSQCLVLSALVLMVAGLLAMTGCKASGMALTQRAQLLKINVYHPNDLPEGAEDNVDVVISNRGVNDIDNILTEVELPPQLIVLDQTADRGILAMHDPGSNVYHFTIGKIHPAEDAHMRFHVRTAFGTAKVTGSINVTAYQRDLPGDKLVEHAAIKLRGA